MTLDAKGKPYLRREQAKVGLKVQLDEGFTCAVFKTVELEASGAGLLFFRCGEGKHYITGQIEMDSDGLYYAGITLAE